MMTPPPRRPVLPPARSLMRTLVNPPPTAAAVVNAPPTAAPAPNNKTKATLNALRARPQTRATVKAIMNLTRKQQAPNMYVPPASGGTKTKKNRRRKF